ncbi:MAG TPA: hypothetical protein VF614_13515 [Chthoniobacteraceae bacterium]|jgi:hypothetical protein
MNALESFALATLRILEADADWSADTTDAIAASASAHGLSGVDREGAFLQLVRTADAAPSL